MKSLIVGVSRVDIAPRKEGERPVNGYTLFVLSDAIGGREVSGQLAEQIFIWDEMLNRARLPIPIPGIYINYEYNKRGKIAAVLGYDYEEGYTYEKTMNSRLIFLLE